MTEIDREWMRRYVEGWREVNRITDAERREWLRALTDEQCREVIRGLFAMPFEPRPKATSGLEQMQAIFRRAR